MKKEKPDKVPGSGKVTSNETSFIQQEEDGMSVPSNKRGGSNKWGANDKGAGERTRDSNKPPN